MDLFQRSRSPLTARIMNLHPHVEDVKKDKQVRSKHFFTGGPVKIETKLSMQ